MLDFLVKRERDESMKNKWIFIISIIFFGTIMRSTFTTLPVVANDIANSLHIPLDQLGLLTSIPLVAFALVSPFVSKITDKFSIEKTLAFALVAVLLGSFVRIFNAPSLMLGTALIGVGIAFINVLLPAAIFEYAPDKIGPYTGIYSTLLMIMTSAFQIIAVPVANKVNWQGLVLLVTVVVLLSLVTWLLNIKINVTVAPSQPQAHEHKPVTINPWTNKYAWMLLIIAGLQSAIFYSLIAWMSVIAQRTGVSGSQSGLLVGLLSMVGIPFGMIIPNFISNSSFKTRRNAMIFACVLWILGLAMMNNHHISFVLWLVISSVLGAVGSIMFIYVITSYATRTKNPQESAALSGMAQSGGYLIACLIPWLYGLIFGMTQNWYAQNIIFILMLVVMIVLIYFFEREKTIFD